MCAVANGLSGFVASVSAGAFYLDYTALAMTIVSRAGAGGGGGGGSDRAGCRAGTVTPQVVPE